jgi:hypothetical protein
MHTYTPHNILITGGAGFIGCHFVRYLLGTDTHVRIVNLDLLTYAGSMDNLKTLPDPDRHIVVSGDICDRTLVHAVREGRLQPLTEWPFRPGVGYDSLANGHGIAAMTIPASQTSQGPRRIISRATTTGSLGGTYL